jgi:3-oxoadipyl-CoA thiolase
MDDVFICGAVRTPVGKYAGSLSSVRTDDLAAIPLRAILERNPSLEPGKIDDVMIGCANQAGEDNRNIARMALLLAGIPHTVPGVTINRLCGSGMDAVAYAARAIWSGEADIIIAGGVESMSRSPYVMAKPSEGFSRSPEIFDTTLGWRFVNPAFKRMYGIDSMMETAENIASEFKISRSEQDEFALSSQHKAAAAQNEKLFDEEIIPVITDGPGGEKITVTRDEHPRSTSIEKLSALKPLVIDKGTVTAGNSSGINDGAAALLIASGRAVKKSNLTPIAVIRGAAAAGVPPRIMGIGPVLATQNLLKRLNISINDIDLIELNEAFAAQALGCMKELGIDRKDQRVNRRGGAIALGHPLGMSGARLITTAAWQLQHQGYKKALCTMCIGVGQGISILIEKA